MATPGSATVRHGGETSCVAIGRSDGAPPTLVLDGGTGLRTLGRVFGSRPFDGTLMLTHLHWDHVIGLPFFAAGDRPGARVRLLLPAQERPAREVLRGVMSPPYFPVAPDGLAGDWSFDGYDEGDHSVAGFTVTAREVPHGGGRTMGLRVSDGAASVAYIPDHAPHFVGPGDDGLGPLHPAAVELAQRADILIHDAQFTADELPARHAYGHAAMEYAVRLAERCGVRRLLLFHHDPCRDDDAIDAMVARARSTTDIAVDAATEGATIDV